MRMKLVKAILASAPMLALGLVLMLAVSSSWTQTANRPASKGAQPVAGTVTRGRYLVEDVAVCSQCHTPHTSPSSLDRLKWLQGAPLWLNPAMPAGNWPLEAPRIAGIVPGTDEDMVRLLTTGIWRDGNRLRPPMPQFRMSREDAEAVVAYLKSGAASPVESRKQTSPR